MFVDMNTAWILTQQQMKQNLFSEHALHVRTLQRQRREARTAWWRNLMRRSRRAAVRGARATVA